MRPDRDPPPTERYLVGARMEKGVFVVTDWHGKERRFMDIVEGIAFAVDLYSVKRVYLRVPPGEGEPLSRWDRPLVPGDKR